MRTATNYRAVREANALAARRVTYRAAIRIMARLEANYAAYLADCESDYRRGYRAHYCEHGTNQWVDYDNICGPCEDGRTMSDPMQRREFALYEAKRIQKEAEDIYAAATLFRKLDISFDSNAAMERIRDLLSE